ncbi:right-handed parallel beta-helix repeat-containing protein [Ferribacterium limneticum]|uniref:hypothetical protein n=1 Tax=Ferribacterium limneticum TaxID=76259 RepID=UPI001CFB405D|nr:hypothetical protein [Ferribacterium limneticum]UCV29794.1 hypothetical protein KI617_06835 [Ferribacterium limneticum]UCV33713.1 hypothetical protein KI608_06835 [Ferribacterium limneticum]
MTPNHFFGRIRMLGIASVLLVQAAWVCAQLPDKLPPSPDYLGEIRRTPDGKLRAVAEEKRFVRSAEAVATMIVGPGEKLTTITEAARLAKDGEVIEIRSGDYRGQPVVWTQNNLLIRGVGERPVMLADGLSAEGKAIWVVRGGKVAIENIEFRGARVASLNGAGIRFEKGSLSIRSCAFFDNEMGILTANFPELSLEVIDSEFGDAPRHKGDLHHLLYVGGIGKFVLRGSRFRNGYLGHLVKSRARENHILYNMLVDGAGGKASYELEFPNGGLAYVIGNTIGQSAGTDNPSIVAYGAEGPRWSDNALYVAHNTLINDAPAGNFVNVRIDKIGGDLEVWLLNNLMVGIGDLFKPAQGRFDGNRLMARGDLIESNGVPLRLTNLSPLRGAVRPPGQARGTELLPDAEFRFPVGSRSMRPSSALAPGAFQ